MTHHDVHRSSPLVMPGLVPGIHVLGPATKDVDGRDVGVKQRFVACRAVTRGISKQPQLPLLPHHCERSEAIHREAKQSWIASLRSR
jgi:hypothetical protein